MKCWVFLAVVLCGLLGDSGAFLQEESSKKGDVLKETIAAIAKLLHFYKNNYDKSINLDAVFGLRVIEGQLKLLDEDFNQDSSKFSFTEANEVLSELRHLSTEATKIVNMAIPHLVEQDPKYFELLKYLVQEPWKVSKPHRFVNHNFSWKRHFVPPGSVPEMSETVSDLCLAQLTGAKSNNGKPDKPCDAITEECLRKFLQPQQFWYTLQHQVLYTVIAQKMGCERVINEYVTARSPESVSLDHVQHVFCTNAFLDLEEYVSRYGIQPAFKDLFLEMQFICPSVGFFQFLRLEWLHEILGWQSQQGCFPGENRTIAETAREKPTKTTTTTTTPSATETLRQNVAQPPLAYPADRVHPVIEEEQRLRMRIPVPVANKDQNPSFRLHHAVVARQDGAYPQRLPPGFPEAPVAPWMKFPNGMGQVPLNSHHPRSNGWYGSHDADVGPLANGQGPYGGEERWANRGLKYAVRGARRRKRSDEGIVAYHDNEVVMPPWRGLKREKALEGGCMAHFTCVAAGALSMYLRYLLDPGPPEFAQHGLINVWMSSHQPSKRPQAVQRIPPSREPSIEERPQSGLLTFAGTYQRRWQLPAVSKSAATGKADDGMPSYVRRTGVRKDLEDRAFVTGKTAMEKGPANVTLEVRGEDLTDLQAEVRRMTLQSDLDHYLVIVTIVSLVCIAMLFKYIYKRRMYFKNRLRHL